MRIENKSKLPQENRRRAIAAAMIYLMPTALVRGQGSSSRNARQVDIKFQTLIADIEYGPTVKSVQRVEATRLKIVWSRLVVNQSLGPSETFIFDLTDIEDFLAIGTDVQLNCRRKNCINVASDEMGNPGQPRTQIRLQAVTSTRAERIATLAYELSRIRK